MDKYYNQILNELEAKINDLEMETEFSTQTLETAINYILYYLSKLKDHILRVGFSSIDDEIRFFKYYKPTLVSKLIYYNAIYKIETKKPPRKKHVKIYLSKELKRLKKFFDNNLDFYRYYRNNNSFLDEKLFLREKHDMRLWLDTFYFEADHRFSTSHDYKVAKIIANDLIQVYLEDQLNNLNNQKKTENLLKWTTSKAALTELIYALYSCGVFNNGNTDIKLIAKTFEEAFNIDLGDFYHTFMELKARKTNRTKFLDSLCEALIKKMDEQDEK